MSTIDITRQHSLDHDQAVEAADELAKSLSSRFDVNYSWDGDILHFKRSGARGNLSVKPEEIHVHLELGVMLSAFKGRIEQEINDRLDNLVKKS